MKDQALYSLLQMIQVQPGTFLMGSPKGEPGRRNEPGLLPSGTERSWDSAWLAAPAKANQNLNKRPRNSPQGSNFLELKPFPLGGLKHFKALNEVQL